MSDHIPDATKMIQDTPRMHSALMDAPDAGFAIVWRVGCDIERELNAAQERIKRLEEAGDRAIENSYYPDRVKVWTEAKEAKP